MTGVKGPGAPTPDDVFRRRLIAAATDEYRFGALSDGDYGADVERLGEVACAQGRQEEIKGIAADLGLTLADDALEAEGRRALRADCERRLAEAAKKLEDTAGPERLSCAQQDAYDEARMVLRYLDDCETVPSGTLDARRGA